MDTSVVARFELFNPALSALFQELEGKKVFFLPNNGNAGDSLIAAATYQVLYYHKIKYQICDTESLIEISNKVVILSGGGNLVPLYSGMAKNLRALIGRGNRIILLPHSIRGHEDLLQSLGPEVTLFCRELDSYEYLLKSAIKAQVGLGHDLALFLDVNLLRMSPGVAEAARVQFIERLAEHATLRPEDIENHSMQCIRGGAESTFKPKGRNYDVSVIFRTGIAPLDAEIGAWMMLEFARLAAEITTNRLHIGIASILCGTPTRLYDNKYGKISAVYNFSIKGNFKNVEMLATPT